jgi:hypothetical protein
MKTLKITTLVIISLSMLFATSCNKRVSLAEKRKLERESIEKNIADNGIEILNEMPADTIFGKNQYWRTPSGLYIQITKKGTGKTPEIDDIITFRYNTYTMTSDMPYVQAMTAEDVRDPVEFTYGVGVYSGNITHNTILNGSNIAHGIQEAIGYLRFDGAAKLILPSAIGSGDAQEEVIAFRYEIGNVKIR